MNKVNEKESNFQTVSRPCDRIIWEWFVRVASEHRAGDRRDPSLIDRSFKTG